MMTFSLFVAFLLCVWTVFASDASAPLEALLFYNQYRMDFDATGGDRDNMYIGFNCFPRDLTPGKPCNFNEFVKSVYSVRGGYKDSTQFDPDDRTRYPGGAEDRATLITMAKDLQKYGFQGVHVDFEQMYKDETHSTNSFSKLLPRLVDRVKNAVSAGKTDRLTAVQQAMQCAYEERFGDMRPIDVANIANQVDRSLGANVMVRSTLTTPMGRPYMGIIWDRTDENLISVSSNEAQYEASKASIMQQFHDFVDSSGQRHFGLLDGWASEMERLQCL